VDEVIFLELFITFFTIGLFTFGGGYAMLPLIQQKVVEKGWMGVEEIVDFVAVSESTPGPFAVNISTYVGTECGKEFGVLGSIFGSFCATLGVVLPSFLIILIVARCYIRFKESKLVSGAMFSLRATVVGLMAGAVWGMLPTVFFHSGIAWEAVLKPEFLCSAGIFATMLVLALKKVSPIIIVVCSAVAGIACGYLFL
jgi:chromate transporter